jgi:DNA-binding XRE family transcriptional regulator
MRMKDRERAFSLAEKIAEQTQGQPYHAQVLRLRKMLQPPPTMKEILAKIEAKDESERAKLVGVSRQGLYNWVNELSRPSVMAAKRLAQLSGIPEDVIRDR